MKLENSTNKPKIKRRNFFYYFSASIAGIFTVSRLPFNFFKSRINNELANSGKPEVRTNPYAVKRGTKGAMNG